MIPQSKKERQVWQACALLVQEGNILSYKDVAQKLLSLGFKRGSNSDLHRFIASYKTYKQNALARPHDALQPLSESAASSLPVEHLIKNGFNALLRTLQHQTPPPPSSPQDKQTLAQLQMENKKLLALIRHKENDHKHQMARLQAELYAYKGQLLQESKRRRDSERDRQLAYARLKERL